MAALCRLSRGLHHPSIGRGRPYLRRTFYPESRLQTGYVALQHCPADARYRNLRLDCHLGPGI